MKRIWCVNERVLEREDGLWWLNKEQHEFNEKCRTPMSIALRNGDISRVLDVKSDGLSTTGKRGWNF
ncbi:MAG: hypothetical protein JSW00_09090 [Thermoplasmata archaeon]|nr:MAG: hypothetical protein JSW00_09090 [Thermoplasmata archaeon]